MEGNDLKLNHWGPYDLENDEDAKRYLIDSISLDLETQLCQNCDNDDSFITYWMNLVHIVKSVTINCFDKIKNKFKERKIADYASENIEEMATDYLNNWEELHEAELYDHNLTRFRLDAIMQAANEDFKFLFRSLKETLDEKLLEICHISYRDAHKEMSKEGLDVPTVLKKAKKHYREMEDDNQWPTADHALDSKAMS